MQSNINIALISDYLKIDVCDLPNNFATQFFVLYPSNNQMLHSASVVHSHR